MEENSIDASQINLRNKGIKLSAGKLHKGCVKDAFTKLSIGSIPSNYESIIYHHEEKRGFGTSQKRFNSNDYRLDLTKGESQSQVFEAEAPKVHHASESKKGFGPIIAKEKREWIKYPHSPGPGKYFKQQLEKLKEEKNKENRKRKCYTGERQDLKRKELKLHKENPDLPGPGYYELSNLNKREMVGCKSSFVSKEARQAYIPKSLTPGPGCYIGQGKTASPTNEKKRQIQQQEYFKKITKEKRPASKVLLERPKNSDIPGPGAYEPDIPNFKPLYQRIKISNNFMQSTKDRFNQSLEKIKQSNQPPVGAYQITSSFDKIQKKLIDMPCFMSESKRVPFNGQGIGPSIFYETSKENKRNFHFNIRGQWI